MNLTTDSKRRVTAAGDARRFLMLLGKHAVAAPLLAAMLALGCGGDAKKDLTELDRQKPATTPAETGTISGRVRLDGPVPELEPFEITANGDVCGSAAKSNLLSVGADSGIAGAVVFIEADGAAPPGAPQTIEQVGCQYTPHVVATTAGSVVRFVNNDPTPHNVRVEDLAGGRVLFNLAQATQGRTDPWKVPAAGSYFVGCDYHPWMNAYIVAVPGTHFAVTDADGRYTIEGVPVGAHTVTVWHNSVKIRQKRDTGGRMIGYRFDPPVTASAPVQVAKNATATLDLALRLGEPTTASTTP